VPDRPTLFVDRSLGKGVVNALRDAGAKVEFHDDHFSQDAEDVEWIPKASENGWVILTKDKHIRRRFHERQAIIDSSARVFTLTSGNMTGAAMASLLVAQLENIEALAASTQAPFVAIVGRDGLDIRTLNPPQQEDTS
jgi:predicted nuclease of predicted toxin-antitoxin system